MYPPSYSNTRRTTKMTHQMTSLLVVLLRFEFKPTEMTIVFVGRVCGELFSSSDSQGSSYRCSCKYCSKHSNVFYRFVLICGGVSDLYVCVCTYAYVRRLINCFVSVYGLDSTLSSISGDVLFPGQCRKNHTTTSLLLRALSHLPFDISN